MPWLRAPALQTYGHHFKSLALHMCWAQFQAARIADSITWILAALLSEAIASHAVVRSVQTPPPSKNKKSNLWWAPQPRSVLHLLKVTRVNTTMPPGGRPHHSLCASREIAYLNACASNATRSTTLSEHLHYVCKHCTNNWWNSPTSTTTRNVWSNMGPGR